MKVLKAAPKEKILWVGKCDTCGAIVEARLDELGNIALGDYRNDNEDYIWGIFPECETHNSICFHRKFDNTGRKLLKDNGLPVL